MTEQAPAGFQADTGTIHAAGQAAIRIGGQVSALSDDVDAACALPAAPAGLGVGSALATIDPQWQQHLRSVGADVTRTGDTLCGVSANYADTEAANSRSFREMMS